MKKIYLAAFLSCSIGWGANAQLNEGGLPWSMRNETLANSANSISTVKLARPDYEGHQKEDELDAITGAAKPYRVAAYVTSNIGLESGKWEYLKDGSKIWKLALTVPDAKAIGVFYDKFELPKGVKLFLLNENGNQILGAYTSNNNSDFGNFVTEEVQGNIVHLELNIAAGVNVADIKFHIDKVTAYYRGVAELERRFATLQEGQLARPTGIGDASSCHVNANCPAGDGEAWAKSKKASVQITMGNAVCSGTMINNTGNTNGGACLPYLLTASHCEGSNSREDATYNQWTFRFNFQSATCEGSSANDGPVSRTGATFKARSNNPSFANNPDGLVTDFLLLQLKTAPPATSYLAGWNINTNIAENEDYPRFISFHHPAGDLKKLAYGEFINASGEFNQQTILNTHWTGYFTVGGSEGGSSGSGFFDHEGLLIGDLSGGIPGGGPCAPMGTEKLYSKISAAWQNNFDQTAFPAFAGAQSRLRDWLDPLGTGVSKLQPAMFDCSDVTSLNDVEKVLDESVILYPNPSTGIVNAKMNFVTGTNLTVSVVNILGSTQKTFNLANVRNGQYTFDLSTLAAGVYMVSIATDNAKIAKRITIIK